MAWVRTATSLISFGFTIYKAFEYLRQREPDVAHGVLDPRNFALVLIGLGIGALLLATVQHRRDLRTLEARYGPLPRSSAAIVAAIMSLLGIVALILVFLRQ
jgi:putative membrane protein